MRSLIGATLLVPALAFGEPHGREGSGTSWLPDSSPVYACMEMLGDDMLMLHGSAFPRYTNIGGGRDVSASGDGGSARLDAPTMFMAMFSHALDEESQLGLRFMGSLDPLIERGYGYPLLYQSGETHEGAPLHDRQHPHDLVDELSATYSRQTFGGQSAYLYFGYPGEPALGPPVFMHRVSGMDYPDAPISHHWQDSSHITWGVATLGYSFGSVKLEGSAFNGREPDEKRYAFDRARFDSYSGRVSWNPAPNLALQASHGYIRTPHGEVSVHRTTASGLFNRPLEGDANLATAFVWGQNRENGEATDAFLAELAWQHERDTVFGRLERVEKTGHDLVLEEALHEAVFVVSSLSVGYVRDFLHGQGIDVGVGSQLTVGRNPEALAELYGGRTHLGYQLFLRLRPSRLSGHAM